MKNSLPLSKYHQVYLVLREQLHEGRFAQGLPGELELARLFGVGRVTVRKALGQLDSEGLIVREVGRGTRPTQAGQRNGAGITRSGVAPSATRLKGLLKNIVTAAQSSSVKVLEWRLIAAPADLAEALHMKEGARLRKVVRRRSVPESPVALLTTWLPHQLMRDISRADLAGAPMLQLLEQSGVELGRAVQTVSARQADTVAAAQLQVAVGSALLSVRRLVYDIHDQPVQLLHGLYRPDRYEYYLELTQVGGVEARVVATEILP